MIEQSGRIKAESKVVSATAVTQVDKHTKPSLQGYSESELCAATKQIEERLRPHETDTELVLSMFAKLSLASIGTHTIFGTKPLSEAFLIENSTPLQDYFQTCITGAEFEAWQRTAPRADLISSHFVVREGEHTLTNTDKKVLLIYNTHQLKEVFTRHHEVFTSKLGPTTTPGTVIDLLHRTPDFNRLFGGDHELKGILIGYGQKSAAAFARLVELLHEAHLGPPTTAEQMLAKLERANLPPNFAKDEFIELIKILEPSTTDSNGLDIRVGLRLHRDDLESKEILAGYNTTSQQLAHLLKNYGVKVVAQIALARWCGLLP